VTRPVWQGIQEGLAEGPLHFTLLDPASSGSEEAARIGARAAELGTHAFLVGGSTDVTAKGLTAVTEAVKEASGKPVIHFPSGAGTVGPAVDALLFMSTLNSRSRRFLVGEQVAGAPFIREMGLETIPLGYVLVEPGMTVGEVSDADLLPRTPEGAEEARAYALTAQFFGMELVYLEAGSGADEPVPTGHVEAAAEADIPVVVGGGIRTPEAARERVEAGADVVVTGTLAEEGDFEALAGVVDAVVP
jgi:phosphoglycerol geranylgeranyltransferase